MARIELGEDFRSIEDIIETRDEARARHLLDEMATQLGRRPEYRYVRLLYETIFTKRADADLLHDTRELVADQPDLAEATALLAVLFSRLGDRTRADLFAREAMSSMSPSAQMRASQILSQRAPPPLAPPSRVPASRRGAAEAPAAFVSAPVPGPAPAAGPAPMTARASSRSSAKRLTPPPSRSPVAAGARSSAPSSRDEERWFEEARRDRLIPRQATHGVKVDRNNLEPLLEWGRLVMLGQTHLADSRLPLTRDGLEMLDAVVGERRKERSHAGAPREEPAEEDVNAIAGFFLAVVLHEIDAHAIETAPDDGLCKIVLPTGAGLRPLAMAAASLSGTGPALTQAFDRLVAVQSPSMTTRAPSVAPPPLARSVPPPPSSVPPPSPQLHGAVPPSVPPSQDELALTRPEVELATVRRLRRPARAEPVPNIDLAAVASAFADSPEGIELAHSAGSERLLPVPQAVALLEAHAAREWPREGLAADVATWQPPDELEETIVAWGAFVGEAIIAAYGGVWQSDPNAPSDPHLFRVVCNEQVAAWPIAHVYLRLKNGVRFNLVEFVASIGRLF